MKILLPDLNHRSPTAISSTLNGVCAACTQYGEARAQVRLWDVKQRDHADLLLCAECAPVLEVVMNGVRALVVEMKEKKAKETPR